MTNPGRRIGQRRGPVRQYAETPSVATVVLASGAFLAINATHQLTVFVYSEPRPTSEEGELQPVTLNGRTVTFASSNVAVATVNGSGLVTAVSAGNAIITAHCEGVTSNGVEMQVTSSAPTVASVSVAPNPFTVFEGATTQLTATPRDGDGFEIPDLTATWATSNALVATVSVGGLVTGVAAGSVTMTATVSGVNGTSAGTVSVVPAAGTLVTFPNASLEFIMGPILTAGDGLIDGSSTTTATHPWPHFDRIWLDRGIYHANRTPKYWPQTLPGTVAITNNSATVTGTGTDFLQSVDPAWPTADGVLYGNVDYWGEIMIRDAGAVWRGPFYAASVTSDTVFTLTTDWTFGDVTGVNITTSNPTRLSGQKQADLVADRFYYDLGHCLYLNAYRTGNGAMWAAANRMGQTLASRHKFGYSTDTNIAPRSLSFCGLATWALVRDAEATTHAMWGHLVRQADAKWPTWVGNRLANSTLYYGLRDGSYTILFQAILATVLPNTFVDTDGGTRTDGAAKRAVYRQRARDACVDYLCRLQGTAPDASAGPPGLWRWDDNDVSPKGKSWSISFQYGLAAEALIATRKLLVATAWPTAQDITDIDMATVQMCEAMYETDSVAVASWTWPAFRQGPITNKLPNTWRSFWYYYYGGVEGDLTRNMPDNLNQESATSDSDHFNKVCEARQNNGLNVAMFGYAYHLTGDAKFLQYGDDIAAANFGCARDGTTGSVLASVGVGADDYGSLAWHVAKNFNQCYRNSAPYFAYRSMTPEA